MGSSMPAACCMCCFTSMTCADTYYTSSPTVRQLGCTPIGVKDTALPSSSPPCRAAAPMSATAFQKVCELRRRSMHARTAAVVITAAATAASPLIPCSADLVRKNLTRLYRRPNCPPQRWRTAILYVSHGAA
eukprot:2886104-Pleurochrysis_carterae.AAC.1